MSTSYFIDNNIKRNNGRFSFSDRLVSFVCNDEFKSGYLQQDKTYDTQSSYIWNALSVIGQDVGETVYENVLNFIDEVSNVDVCKTQALKSMVNMIGTEYSLLNAVHQYPTEIQNIVDVLSINKKYLLNTKVLDRYLTFDIKNRIYRSSKGRFELSSLSNDITCFNIDDSSFSFKKDMSSLYLPGTICGEDYDSFLCSIIYDTMVKVVNMPYNDGSETPLWSLSSNYDEFTRSVNKAVVDKEDNKKKLQHNIDLSFNQSKIVDDIDNGLDSIDNYSGYKMDLIMEEIDNRAATLKESKNLLKTRYSYYRKKKVKEFFDFIELQWNSLREINSVSENRYYMNSNYLEFDKEYNIQTLIDKDTGTIRYDMISDVSRRIVEVVKYIIKLRDDIKIQVQKNFMKGTNNLLRYVVNQYLMEFSKSSVFDDVELSTIQNKIRNMVVDDICLVEYDDTTEYFNIKTDYSYKSQNYNKVNNRFWTNDDEDQNSDSGYAFTQQEIDNFYSNTMNMKHDVQSNENFLCTLFENGATKSYSNNNKSTNPNVYIYGNSGISSVNQQIFLSYNGNRFGYNPYINHKNVTHSSYQIHPYLKKFIRHVDIKYPIKNAFYNELNIQLEDEYATYKLSAYLGEYGQPVDVAMNNLFDYSGYKTTYEISPHETELNSNSKKIPLVDYDGSFYPRAVYDYIADPCEFIHQVSSMYTGTRDTETYFEKYYAHLNLNVNQYKRIAMQLCSYYVEISSIVENKSEISDVYDIYEYGMDAYDNVYMIFKKYQGGTSEYDKMNTTGQVWIRMKYHPIAFPAFYGKYPQVNTEAHNFNGDIGFLAQKNGNVHDMKTDSTGMKYFYDMDFTGNKRGIMFIVDPMNDIGTNPSEYTMSHTSAISSAYYRDIQHSDQIACKIVQEYNTNTKMYELFLQDDDSFSDELNIDSQIRMNRSRFDDKDEFLSSGVSADAYVGMIKDNEHIGPVFIQKTMRKFDDGRVGYSINNDDIWLNIIKWKYGSGVFTSHRNRLGFSDYDSSISNYQICDGIVRFGYYNDVVTLAFVVDNGNGCQISVQNYNGKHQSDNGISGACGYSIYQLSTEGNTIERLDGEMNSFDSIDKYIAIMDVKVASNEQTVYSAHVYNLNSDASYIPAYSGDYGKSDYSKGDYFKEQYKPVELLGYSRNIDKFLSSVIPNPKPMLKIEDIQNKERYGRVWEFYKNNTCDNSLVQVSFNQMDQNGGNIKYAELRWIVNLADYDFTEKEISDLVIVMYNSNTCGKNPYYNGPLSAIAYDEPSAYLDLSSSTYMPSSDDSEILSKSDRCVSMVGTNSHLSNVVNKYENNHLFNIGNIRIKLDTNPQSRNYNSIIVLFQRESASVDNYIADDTIYITMCNRRDLRIFNFYHYMDNNGMISSMEMARKLSSTMLSDYSALSDIPFLSGQNTIGIKYSEEDYFPISSPYYYYTVLNEKYPERNIDFWSMDFQYSRLSENVFGENNVFILKDINDDIVDNIGGIDIPIYLNNVNSYRAFEDYNFREDGGTPISKIYHPGNPMSLSSVRFFMDIADISYQKQIDEQQFGYNSTEQVTYQLDEQGIYASTLEQSKNGSQNQSIYHEVALSDFDGFRSYLNIYVNYRRNEDMTHTLFFNYMNYINTPFVKFDGEYVTIDTISGTYLKLEPGQSGVLDIILQFKCYEHDNITLRGVQNVIVTSYEITNVSDDKPKFLLNRIFAIEKNALKSKLEVLSEF